MKQFQNLEKWVQMQWEASYLGDKRRNKRAIKLATSLTMKPNESLPYQMESWANLKGAHRLLGSHDITHEHLQEFHWKNTAEKIKQAKCPILVIQDTSELDYTKKTSTKGIGPIGNHRCRGLLVHSCLAVEYKKSEKKVLGLAHQHVWKRDNISYKRIETRAQRNARNNEGKLWQASLEKISKYSIPNSHVINIGDRGNDMFTFLSYCKNNMWNYVIRAKHNRTITQNNKNIKLFDYIKSAPIKAKKVICLKEDTIELNLSWESVKITIPKNIKHKNLCHDLDLYVMRCANEKYNIEWILLTNLAICTKHDALEKVDWYSTRWLIEEYHKCLKTGCAIEKRNLKTAESLKNLLGFLGVIATKLLEIKFLAKSHKEILAHKFIDKLFLKIVCFKFHLPYKQITCKDFWHSIAKMGGFIGRKSDGDPGWQTLWKGWMRILEIINSFEVMQKCG